MLRSDLLNLLIRRHGYRRYLEIGVADGECFSAVECEHKDSVDITGEPTHLMTSDEFFAAYHEPYDIIFVDGDHSEAAASRDIENALDLISDGGTVVVHDCNPTCEAFQTDEMQDGTWMGGVWKAIARLRTDPALSVRTVDIDCGCAVIRFGEQKPMRVDEPLTYAMLDADRKRILNLISESKFVASL